MIVYFRVQASDNYFFEQFIQNPAVDNESPVNDAAQLTIVKLTINENQQALDVSFLLVF